MQSNEKGARIRGLRRTATELGPVGSTPDAGKSLSRIL